ncbi:ubiquitin-activating enzyme E1 [Skeletonema marinoi]|uniref:Ubiquitin-activating enzyme E1 n=1 Tax=Skeletonema marinoi TaxID=267567 RepID=A0AAD8YH88_9STRA|nr:ubiquitin-activating enzyme E1 [Skeletonema marinoi]
MTKRSTTATNSNDNNNNHSPTNKRIKMADGGEVVLNWGDWMGSYKTGNLVDNESERIDRQKAAFGGDTIARLKDLNVLIVGMQGVGVETAKNLILSNVGGVMLYDGGIVCKEEHRGSNFYVTREHVLEEETTLGAASLTELRTLNPFCRVDLLDGNSTLTEEIMNKDVLGTRRGYAAVVVATMLPKKELFQLNELARANGIASSWQLRMITDATGEPTQTLAISNVEVLDSKPKLLDVAGVKEGEQVVVVTVAKMNTDLRQGMEGLNGMSVTVKRVAIASPTAAKVDTRGVAFKTALGLPTESVVSNFERQYDFYKSAFDEDEGNANKKFPVRTITIFNRLAFVLNDDNGKKMLEKPASMHSVNMNLEVTQSSTPSHLQAIQVSCRNLARDAGATNAPRLDFHEKNNRWPQLHNADDSSQMVEIAKSISDSRKDIEGACWAQSIQYGFPMGEPHDVDEKRIARYSRLFAAELTGFCAFLGGAAAQEVIKASGKFTPIDQWVHHDEEALVVDDIAIMGKDFQARAANQRVFLVGCGALGCEYLKGLALMGIATGKDGKIVVTDMDRIEVSNLSRHSCLEKKVGDDSEDYFNDKFWENLSVCWNALDNVQARQYTDARCLFYTKPLLESGTLGQSAITNYNDGKESDDNENQIAMCTLRSFPYLPKHCIEYAKQAYFSDYFEFGPDVYENFRQDPMAFFEQLDTMDSGEQSRALRMIKAFIDLQEEAGGSIDLMPDEMEKSSGKKFWTGTKRRPRPVDWNDPMPLLMEYLYSTANLYASVWRAEVVRDRSEFQAVVDELKLEQAIWEPSGDKVDLSEGDNEEESGDSGEDDEKLKGELYKFAADTSKLQPAQPQEFEKDDDLNFHIDFLTAATNMRSWNYDIKASPRHAVKVTAGRIIPALATTTAMVCGLVDIEFANSCLACSHKAVTSFSTPTLIWLQAVETSQHLHQTLPFQSPRVGCPATTSFTSWDRIDISYKLNELSVEQLVAYLEKSFGVTVNRIFLHGDTEDRALYNALDKKKLDWTISYNDEGKVQLVTVEKVKVSLEQTKESFMKKFQGNVSDAYLQVYRPSEEGEKQDYFDAVFKGRDYLTLGVDCHTEEKEDITLPCVKYTF